MCCWWEGLILRQGGPLGVQEEIVEEINFLSDGGHLVAMFVQDVFSYKLGSLCDKDVACCLLVRQTNKQADRQTDGLGPDLELLATQRAEPLVFTELLGVG